MGKYRVIIVMVWATSGWVMSASDSHDVNMESLPYCTND
jgi:hypothetical protein